jgi:hypothetical protein
LAENTVVLAAGQKLSALNLESGAQSAVPAAATAWCQKPTRYTTNVPDGDSPTTSYQGNDALFPCRPTGTAIAPPNTVPRFVGPSLSGLVAWSDANQVVARPPAG